MQLSSSLSPPAYTLYGARGGTCLRVAIALEELKLPYRVVGVDLERSEQQSPEFLALNPFGQVPVLIDRSSPGAPHVLAQSSAILLHLASLRPGRLIPSDAARRAMTMERFFFFLVDVIAVSHQAFWLKSKGGDAAAIEALDQRAITALRHAERFDPASRFIAGDSFTIADIAGLTIARYYEHAIDWAALPGLRDWLTRVTSRPAVARGLRAFDGAVDVTHPAPESDRDAPINEFKSA